jgi:DNA-nicking Smr family endonuclease
MKKRHPTQADLALWRSVTRDVIPLAGHLEIDPEEQKIDLPSPIEPAPPQVVDPPKSAQPLSHSLEHGLQKRIRAGHIKIEARLDLHGMTQTEAHKALQDFIAKCLATDLRLGLVITGKGQQGSGVLKQNVPRWLDAPVLRSSIKAIQPAFDRHGGSGAFYISFVRRRKGAAYPHR